MWSTVSIKLRQTCSGDWIVQKHKIKLHEKVQKHFLLWELVNPREWGSSREQVGGCCLQNGRKTQTRQSRGAGYLQYRPWPQQPPIPNTTSPRLQIFTFDSSVILPSTALRPGPQEGGRNGLEEVAHAAGHGNVYVSSRSPPTVFPPLCPVLPQPLEVVHNMQQTSSRPSPRLILHPPRSRKQPHRCFGPRGVERLQLRGSAGGERLRCPLAGTE